VADLGDYTPLERKWARGEPVDSDLFPQFKRVRRTLATDASDGDMQLAALQEETKVHLKTFEIQRIASRCSHPQRLLAETSRKAEGKRRKGGDNGAKCGMPCELVPNDDLKI
jgi:hypothetical protein